MVNAFVNQTEALQFTRDLTEQRERLFVDFAISVGMSALIRDDWYLRESLPGRPFDLLAYAKAMRAMARHENDIKRILAGEITNLEDDLDGF